MSTRQNLLPVGTYVRVTLHPGRSVHPFTGKVAGYDLCGSKYRILYEFAPGKFSREAEWLAYPSEVEEVLPSEAYLFFDGMAWPNPEDPTEVEWALNHGEPTQGQLRTAASFVAAYKQLVLGLKRDRNANVTRIKKELAKRQAER